MQDQRKFKNVFFLLDRVVEEEQSLMELGVQPHSSIRMEMSSTDPSSHPLRPPRPPEHNMPDVLTVKVQTGMNTQPFVLHILCEWQLDVEATV